MGTEALDIGFFDPFKNNIIKMEGDEFTIKILNPIAFDRDLVIKYFDVATIKYERSSRHAKPYITFVCKPKTEEIRKILTSMVFNITITCNGFPDEY